MSRPEHIAPPEVFYNETEARKYSDSTRIIHIQAEMSERAISLLGLPENESRLILDVGCGSGLSGEVLEEHGHSWVGVDISPSMLDIAIEREIHGDIFLQDIGQGLGFRPGMFDGCISISVIQWLCNADKQSHNPWKRLNKFFTTLYTCLAKGARAIFQFYPENPSQVEMIVNAAMKTGFTGGLVIDYPNSTKAKKYFLCLFAGQSNPTDLPKGLTEEDDQSRGVKFSTERIRSRTKNSKKNIKDKQWVLKKKESRKKKGLKTAGESKFTARRRGPKF